MTASEIARYAERTGRVWLGGEMEFPAHQGIQVAHQVASQIAEACGYIVSVRPNGALEVIGGDIVGAVVLDWRGENLVTVTIETQDYAYVGC